MSFGSRLQDLRKKNNLTQDELGEKLYVTRASVSKWERDLCLPAEDTLERISELFGVPVEDLLDKKDIIKTTDRMRKNTRRIIILSVSAFTVLLGCILVLLVLVLRKDNGKETCYISLTGLDEEYLYADTENGSMEIPLSDVRSLKEGEVTLSFDELSYHDYGTLTKDKKKYDIEITDHEDTTGLIIPEGYYGFLLSFENGLATVPLNTDCPLYVDTLDAEEDLGSYYKTTNLSSTLSIPEEMSLNLEYYNRFLDNPCEKSVNVYGITGVDNGGYAVEFLKNVSDSASLTSKLFKREKLYSGEKLYKERHSFSFTFTERKKTSLTVYQYDSDMNLINTFAIKGDYIFEDGFLSGSVDSFCDVLEAGGKKYFDPALSFSETYEKYLPLKSGFYVWR